MDPRFTICLVLLVFLTFSPKARASEEPTRYICAARVDCGAPALPSTQDLPTVSTPTVVSKSVERARAKCVAVHTSAYLRLAKSIDELTPIGALGASRGCKVLSEAFPAE